MNCSFGEEKECNVRCQYYHTCTRSVFRKQAQAESEKSK